MKFKLKKLVFLFAFLLVFYAIYFIVVHQSFLNLHELSYEPINYRNFGEMNRLKYEMLGKMKGEKLVSNKLKLKHYQEIDCVINGEYNINCLKASLNQIYMPFSFVRDYFGVYGKLDKNNQFHFEHSYSKIYRPTEKYDFRRKFLWFENYAVENRPRVKLISALYNVPISSQWNSNGHFYPIQIAQFGLSNFNKFLLYGEPRYIYIGVDKYLKNDQSDFKNDLKLNETDFREIEIKSDDVNNQVNIEQLTNDNLNQSLNEIDRKLLFDAKRQIDKIDKSIDELNNDDNSPESDEQMNKNEQTRINDMNQNTIYLNSSSIFLTLNLARNSSFYNSLFLSFKFKSVNNLRVTCVLMNEKRMKFKIHYRTTNHDLFKNDNIIYGIGNSTEWRLFARDLGVDLIKSINLSRKKKLINLKAKNLHLYRVVFNGRAILKEIKLSSNGYFNQFTHAVNWLLMKQDENGGWASKVNKRLVSESLILNSNWYSSMAQGHSISLLVRAFHYRNEFHLIDSPPNNSSYEFNKTTSTSRLMNDELMRMRVKSRLINQIVSESEASEMENCFVDDDNQILNNSLIYLNAAIDAVNLFKKNVSQNGISTFFMDKYRFYEEFPTTPSLFVLNGFMFSLFGLHDLKMTLDLLISNRVLEPSLNNHYLVKLKDVNELFDQGIISLKKLLPLYDTGSSSLYDLRSFTLKVSPNLARWDYHCVHINLLLHLNTLLDDQNIDNCAQRWINYTKGKLAKHN